MDSTTELTRKATDIFKELAWPSVDEEFWRRTDLSRLIPKGTLDKAVANSEKQSKESPALEERTTPLLPDDYAARIITKGGMPIAMAVSDKACEAGLTISWISREDIPENMQTIGLKDLEENNDRITAWHWKDISGILNIGLSSNRALDLPVVIEECIANDKQSYCAPHLHLETQTGAELTVVWSFEGASKQASDGLTIVNPGLTATAGANSKLNIILRQALERNTVYFQNCQLQLMRDSQLTFHEFQLGCSLIKTRLRATLAQDGCHAWLNGIYTARGGQHVDIGTVQEHKAPNTNSNALYKGSIKANSQSIYQGLIEVAPKASKTDAYLTNNNLILEHGARADSIPQLNILTDDVKCSHGSTTGKLDPGQLFYLQTRGYSLQEATRELTRGFLCVALDGLPQSIADKLELDIDLALDET